MKHFATTPVFRTMATEQTLQAQLDATKAQIVPQIPAELLKTMGSATEALAASGIEQAGTQAGSAMPAFELKDFTGAAMKSSELLAKGPLVVAFYRGGWCPYCNVQLWSYAKVYEQVKALGATLVAISPEKPELAAETAKSDELPFPVLYDAEMAVSRAFGLVFELPADLKEVYGGAFKLDLADRHAASNGKWELPLPAVFVVAADGTVATAHRPADYTVRKEPKAILADLEALQKK